MKSINLTQGFLIDFLKEYSKKYDSFPTSSKLKKELGIRNDLKLKKLLKEMQNLDLIRINYITKAIEYTPNPLSNLVNFVSVPLLGKIAAGKPIEAIVDNDNTLIVPSKLTRNKEVFALKVAGDSMIDSYLLPNDIVICEKTSSALNGDLVVALFMDNTATLKKYFLEKGGQIRLQPMNEKYPPIFTKKITIQGKVISLVREFIN